ncbi:MAG: universal stress protein [Maribacter arcticus]|jgi:nucleotide-binding universal stress UspA family protein|uniref:universal stress protein n=1 Tax=Maribacter arcticus TaxID=561365 RepID=UPI00300399EE
MAQPTNQNLIKLYSSILFGFAFSPSLKVNILESTRIAHLLNCKLILLHVGKNTPEKLSEINTIVSQTEHSSLPIDILWKEGNPESVITKACLDLNIDLLILGALQHENRFQFYVGSIARKLTRKVNCSVLLLIKPAEKRVPCKHVVVNGLDAPDTPMAIEHAFYFSNLLGAQQITIVEEILTKEIHVTVEDDRSLKKANIIKQRLRQREESRVKNIVNALPVDITKNIKVKTQSIFGKRGYSIGHYAEVVRADLLVMNAPTKTGIWDRIFPHDIEYILSDLPTDLLIVRKQI